MGSVSRELPDTDGQATRARAQEIWRCRDHMGSPGQPLGGGPCQQEVVGGVGQGGSVRRPFLSLFVTKARHESRYLVRLLQYSPV